MMSDIIVFENLRFRPPTRKRKADYFKNLPFGTVFENLRFSVPQHGVYVWKEG